VSLLLFLLVACKEDIEPNGRWNVTITGSGSEDPCIESIEGFQEIYEYSLYYEGSFLEIRVDGEPFATGEFRGCSITYESGVYLEESTNGDFRWQIEGRSDVESAAGGCPDVPDDYDWFGTETLTVVSTENDAIEEGCTYNMDSTGVFIQ
jgi:hypothetical protein